jgi:tRNA 2-thiouridine synthesizing protein E
MVSEDGLADLCDENGFLSDTDRWSDDIARALAAQEGIMLTDAHWEVLSLLREYFAAFGDSPANRALVNYTKQQFGKDKGNSLYLMGLFPGSPARVGSRIAGLPKPKNCL